MKTNLKIPPKTKAHQHEGVKQVSHKPSDLIRRVRKELLTRGLLGKQKEARDWLIAKAKETTAFSGINRQSLIATRSRGRFSVELGEMYFFLYDPKHKDTLPYYDIFPLIFPIQSYVDGFLGINMHYLPFAYRAKLMDALLDAKVGKHEDARLAISYDILTRMGGLWRPCLKRYLSEHVRSKFIHVKANEWEWALYLPSEHFEKMTTAEVQRESVRMAYR